MNRSTTVLAAALAGTISLMLANVSLANDERPSYSFVALDYVYSSINTEPVPSNGDSLYVPMGARLVGSLEMFDQLLLKASYYAGQGEYKSSHDVDASITTLSVGWLAPTTDATGIDISLDYRIDDLELDKPVGIDDDISGFGFSIGVRTLPAEWLELGFRTGWYQGDFDGAIAFQISAAWNITDALAITTSWDRIDADPDIGVAGATYEQNQYALGARLSF